MAEYVSDGLKIVRSKLVALRPNHWPNDDLRHGSAPFSELANNSIDNARLEPTPPSVSDGDRPGVGNKRQGRTVRALDSDWLPWQLGHNTISFWGDARGPSKARCVKNTCSVDLANNSPAAFHYVAATGGKPFGLGVYMKVSIAGFGEGQFDC